ncbi:MAG: hypothetical protein EBZ74_04250 [Planctomycetia bacterium]|nr:hypothetical protein [Planctomycetia bacterium]
MSDARFRASARLVACVAISISVPRTAPCSGPPVAVEQPPSVVVVGVDAERAAAIAGHAERVRRTAFEQLLGDASPAAWTERCEIHVHATPAAFAAAVGAAPDEARGATSLEFAAGRVALRRIDVMGDGPDTVPDAVAHELVHVVLADRFTAAAPPRWADEGIALLFDDAEKQAAHEADFRAARARGLDYSGADLVALEEYPADARRQRVFYGQSAALVRWLIARRDAATFVRFVRDSQSRDLAAALERHYDLDTRTLFDSAWKEVPPIHSLSFNNADTQ